MKSCETNKADLYNAGTLELQRMIRSSITEETPKCNSCSSLLIDKQWITRVFGCTPTNSSRKPFCVLICMHFCFVILNKWYQNWRIVDKYKQIDAKIRSMFFANCNGRSLSRKALPKVSNTALPSLLRPRSGCSRRAKFLTRTDQSWQMAFFFPSFNLLGKETYKNCIPKSLYTREIESMGRPWRGGEEWICSSHKNNELNPLNWPHSWKDTSYIKGNTSLRNSRQVTGRINMAQVRYKTKY